MEKRSVLCAFVAALLWMGCAPDEGGVFDPETRFIGQFDPPEEPSLPPFMGDVESTWHPRTHPPGTLLVDHDRVMWMVENWLERREVSGDDVLGEINLDDQEAIPMSWEEERCLLPVGGDYWFPASMGWMDYIAPGEDGGTWLLNWERRLRRTASTGALKSWGFIPWTDGFDFGDAEWATFRVVNPLGFRDGSLFVTEDGTYYYMIRDGAWRIDPELAAAVGYDLTRAHHSSRDAFFLHTTFAGELVREFFSLCPADEPIGSDPDNDGDGSPFARDCDDTDPSVSPLQTETCNSFDDNCDGLVDDVETCFSL